MLSHKKNTLFVYSLIYFTVDYKYTDSLIIYLHEIELLEKTIAKNMTGFEHFSSLKLFIDMSLSLPTTETTINNCRRKNYYYDIRIS